MQKLCRSLFAVLLFFTSFSTACCQKDNPPSSSINDNSYEQTSSEPLPKYTYRNIPYGNHARQTMDIYLPHATTRQEYPVMLTIHGGEWVHGDKEQLERYTAIALQNNCIHVNINYRLLGNGIDVNAYMPYAEMLNDIENAFRFLSNNAEKYHVDTSKACIAGYSSGGHLALLYAYSRTNASIPIQLVISEAGPTNFLDPKTFTEDGEVWIHEAHNDHDQVKITPGMTKQKRIELIEDITGTQYGDVNWEDAWRNASPAYLANENSPKTVLIYSAHDPVIPISHAEFLQSKLSNCTLHEIWGAGHNLYENFNIMEQFETLLNSTLSEFTSTTLTMQ